MRALIFAAGFALLVQAQPPKTKVVPVTETMHGVSITDPYRWLEDQGSPQTRAWIDAEWLLPATSEMKFMFSEVDLARARLIRDLKVDLGVNDDGIAIVLHLLDQLHGLRHLLRDMPGDGDVQSSR